MGRLSAVIKSHMIYLAELLGYQATLTPLLLYVVPLEQDT